jgi:hypothetical protein
MGGFKCFGSAVITLAGIELAHRIRKRQFSLGRGRYQNFASLKQFWERALGWYFAGGSQPFRFGPESFRNRNFERR